MLKDCEAKIEWARDSDHYPVWVKIQLNKKKKEKENNQKAGTKRYWKPTEQQWEEYNRHLREVLVTQHRDEWEAVKLHNDTHEPDSPFTLALTKEEEQQREALAKSGHYCPSTPTEAGTREIYEQILLGDSLADRWEQKRTGIHHNENIPHTPSEGEDAQPQTPNTDIYIEAHEDMARPSLHQWIDALHEAAEAHLEKMPGEKRRDYISKQTWEKIEQLNELSKGQQAPEAFQES